MKIPIPNSNHNSNEKSHYHQIFTNKQYKNNLLTVMGMNYKETISKCYVLISVRIRRNVSGDNCLVKNAIVVDFQQCPNK